MSQNYKGAVTLLKLQGEEKSIVIGSSMKHKSSSSITTFSVGQHSCNLNRLQNLSPSRKIPECVNSYWMKWLNFTHKTRWIMINVTSLGLFYSVIDQIQTGC